MIRLMSIVIFLGALWSQSLNGKPNGSSLFCEANPDSPSCAGTALACDYCHAAVPPAFNDFGACFSKSLLDNGALFPTSVDGMKDALANIEDFDCDKDGLPNKLEIELGSFPGNSESRPDTDPCGSEEESDKNSIYSLCNYDHDYVYKKVWIDFCGELPEYDDFKKFKDLSTDAEKVTAIDEQLDECFDSAHWIGKNGVVWEIGHYKIRPVGSVKFGEDEGVLPTVDYYQDFHLFVWSQIDGNDAREQLTADYTVTRSETGNTVRYTKQNPSRLNDGQVMQVDNRVGLLSSFWNLAFYLNYTPIARVLVAQAFRGFVGISMAKMQGLNPPPRDESQYADYDLKGMEKPECASCHTTIDPLVYPWRNYNGLTGTSEVLGGVNASGLQSLSGLGTEENLTPLSYSLPRLEFFEDRMPGISQMPEAGYIFGQRVENLKEWAEVMANSDQFAANTVRDYWRVLIGPDIYSYQQDEFKTLWRTLKTGHNYNVEAMLKDLIKTEAYGAP